MICNSAAGDVECRPVVNRGTDDRQTECNIYRLSKRETFYRHQSLIVVARRHRVELTSERAEEQGVGREGTCYVDTFSTTLFDCGLDLAGFFRAEQSVFTGVRIQSRNGDARPGDSMSAELAISQFDRASDPFGRDRFDCLRKAAVNGQQKDSKITSEEAHQGFRCAAQSGQHFGVTGIWRTGELERFFVDRSGGHRLQPSVKTKAHACFNCRNRSSSRTRRQTSPFHGSIKAVRIEDDWAIEARESEIAFVSYGEIGSEAERARLSADLERIACNERQANVADLFIGDGLQYNFGSDAGRVSDRNSNARFVGTRCWIHGFHHREVGNGVIVDESLLVTPR